MENLETRLLALVKHVPAPALDRLQQCLREGLVTAASSPAAVARALSPESIRADVLVPLMVAWGSVGAGRVPAPALALALGAARNSRARAEEAAPRVELAWTGPYGPAGINARPTLSIMHEMIAGARERILLVGYDLTRGSVASESVVEGLARARVAGAQITVALHDDGDNHRILAELWPRPLRPPRLLRWVGRPGDRMAKLHAKLLVADGRDLLVTSANLTWHGLEQNIEMGVRVSGHTAFKVEDHFGKLELGGILVPYEL